MKYGVDVEAQIVHWVREGQLDQLMGDDVAQITDQGSCPWLTGILAPRRCARSR